MEYTIKISKVVENPEYVKPEEDRFYGRGMHEDRMPQWIEKDTTIATLDEEQFKKVQKAIVEALK